MTLVLHPCALPDPVPDPIGARPPVVEPAPLVRFVALGLLATLDCHRAGGLAPGRFGWELSARIDELARLKVPPRTVTRLRWLGRAVTRSVDGAGARPGAATEDLIRLRTAIGDLVSGPVGGDEGA